MYDGIITAYSTATGEPHQIPEHWLDDPKLSKGFTTTPPTPESAPTMSDSKSDIEKYAADHSIDLGEASTKAEMLDAIAAATPTPDGDESSEQTPA